MVKLLNKARCIIVALFVTFVALFLYASSGESEAERRWGIDYQGNITEYSIKIYPEMFNGFYMRKNNVIVERNALLDSIMNTISGTDISKIFGVPMPSNPYVYLFVYDVSPKKSPQAIDPTSFSEWPVDSIENIYKGLKEIYVSMVECDNIFSKYFFAYQNQIIFTPQWLGGWFIDKKRLFNFILGPTLCLQEKTIVWRFVVNDGVIKERSVGLDWYYDDYTPIYHFDTDSMGIIRFNPE